MEVVASLSQGRTAAAQCGLFTHKSVPVIFETPRIFTSFSYLLGDCHNRKEVTNHMTRKSGATRTPKLKTFYVHLKMYVLTFINETSLVA